MGKRYAPLPDRIPGRGVFIYPDKTRYYALIPPVVQTPHGHEIRPAFPG